MTATPCKPKGCGAHFYAIESLQAAVVRCGLCGRMGQVAVRIGVRTDEDVYDTANQYWESLELRTKIQAQTMSTRATIADIFPDGSIRAVGWSGVVNVRICGRMLAENHLGDPHKVIHLMERLSHETGNPIREYHDTEEWVQAALRDGCEYGYLHCHRWDGSWDFAVHLRKETKTAGSEMPYIGYVTDIVERKRRRGDLPEGVEDGDRTWYLVTTYEPEPEKVAA